MTGTLDTDPHPMGPCVRSSEVCHRSILCKNTALKRPEIKDHLGAPDLALLPIAAGACLPFIESLFRIKLDQMFLTRHLHSPPEDAFRVHLDLEARISVGVHWGTFTTDTGARETRAEVERLERKDFLTVDVGLWIEGETDPIERGWK